MERMESDEEPVKVEEHREDSDEELDEYEELSVKSDEKYDNGEGGRRIKPQDSNLLDRLLQCVKDHLLHVVLGAQGLEHVAGLQVQVQAEPGQSAIIKLSPSAQKEVRLMHPG